MTRGRSASRKRSVKGRSQTRRIPRQPSTHYLKSTCTRSPCEYWHPPECQFLKLNRDAKQVTRGRLHTGKLKVNGWLRRSEGFPRTRITKSSCACDCGRGPVSVGAFFFLLSFFFLLLSSSLTQNRGKSVCSALQG